MFESLSQQFVLIVAQAGEATEAVDPETTSVAVESVWDFVIKGGVMMIPLGICSLIGFAVFVERLVSLRRRRIIPPGFMGSLKEAINGGGRSGIRAGLECCEKNGSPAANIFAAGIKKLGGPIEVVERHIQEAGEREALRMRKYLRVLSVIASVAPLMGLLGTIFGMIVAFQTVATSADALGKTELLAKGIYQAMITTAAGLVVAIPALVAYHYLTARIQSIVMDIDMASVDFLEDLAEEQSIRADEEPVATVEVATSSNGELTTPRVSAPAEQESAT